MDREDVMAHHQAGLPRYAVRKESRKVEIRNDGNGDSDPAQRQALVLGHLNALKPKEREVLVLRMQEGMSYNEIAKVLKRSEGHVGTLIHTATRKLTQSLRQAGVVS